MDILQIEAFLAVIQSGGFSNAGAVLHLSQPAVSRRILLLEQDLGIRLFDRMRGETALTESGRMFLPHAQRVLAALRDGLDAVKSMETREQGTVRIGFVGTLASTDMTGKLIAFRQRHPDVRLEVRTGRSMEISEMVQRGDIHLGIRYFSDSSPDLISQTIRNEDLAVACSSQHSFGKKKSLRARDLGGIPWVSFPAGSSGEPFARVLTLQLEKAGLKDPEMIYIDSLTAQKRLVEADFGVGLFPTSSILEELQLGSLQVLKVPELRASVPVVLHHRIQGFLSKAARSLKDLLSAE